MNENNEMIKTVALGLQELNQKVVFVGGVVAHVYVTNPNSLKPRVTKDVDCVIELSTLAEQL